MPVNPQDLQPAADVNSTINGGPPEPKRSRTHRANEATFYEIDYPLAAALEGDYLTDATLRPEDADASMGFNEGEDWSPPKVGGGPPHGARGTEEEPGGDVEMGAHEGAGAAAAEIELGQLKVKLYPSGTPVGEEHLYNHLRTRHSKIITDAIRQFRHYAREILEVDGSEQICIHLGNGIRCFFITQQTKSSKTATVLTDKHDARPTAWYAPAGKPMKHKLGPMPYQDPLETVGPGKARTVVPSMFLPCTLLVFLEKGSRRCAARLFAGAVRNRYESEWKVATTLKTIRSELTVSDDADMHYCVLALETSKAPKDNCGPTGQGAAPIAAKERIKDLYIDITG
tara:strand:+ start:1104 stop:2129 length:1026 start_codon:yes stop_codon:yes gene_type:complete